MLMIQLFHKLYYFYKKYGGYFPFISGILRIKTKLIKIWDYSYCISKRSSSGSLWYVLRRSKNDTWKILGTKFSQNEKLKEEINFYASVTMSTENMENEKSYSRREIVLFLKH